MQKKILEGQHKNLLIGIFGIALVALVIGLSYAMYTFAGVGTKENVITTGQIVVSFNEENSILLTNRYPETDAEGIANPDENSTMNFSISSDIVGDATVNYAIGIVDISEGATLTQDYIKIYATKNGNTASGFTSGAGKTIKSFEGNKIDGFLDSHVIIQDTVTAKQVVKYTIKAWIDENYDLPITDNSNGTNHSNQTTSETFSFKIKVVSVDTLTYGDTSPNAPELATGMIPVYYDATSGTASGETSGETASGWKKADSTNSNNNWYDYDNKIWANAVTVSAATRTRYLSAPAGTPISMDDINTMWVWIPRFSATNRALDCSTIKNPTVEEYPDCYDIGISNADKTKLINYCVEEWGDTETECTSSIEGIIADGYNERNETMDNWLTWYEEDTGDNSIEVTYTFNSTNINKHNGGTKSAPGAFNITFVDNKTSAHDAFTFGTQSLNGIWVGKFETSHETLSSSTTANNLGCTNDICSNANGIIIKPNVVSLRYNNVSNFFYASLSMKQSGNSFGFDTGIDTTLDTHMMKNNEWGAVAYLTQSIYGRCTSSTFCTEIGINNYSSASGYITGYGAPAGSSSSATKGTYETALGKDASTTGNIYGVYDMSGGADEYVMGVYTDGTRNWSGYSSTSNSGFSGCLGISCNSTYDGVAYPESKYYNSYTTSTNYINANLQHALTETKNWYGDYDGFVDDDNPWFRRGGFFYHASGAGVFNYNSIVGSSDSDYGSRYSLVIN